MGKLCAQSASACSPTTYRFRVPTKGISSCTKTIFKAFCPLSRARIFPTVSSILSLFPQIYAVVRNVETKRWISTTSGAISNMFELPSRRCQAGPYIQYTVSLSFLHCFLLFSLRRKLAVRKCSLEAIPNQSRLGEGYLRRFVQRILNKHIVYSHFFGVALSSCFR